MAENIGAERSSPTPRQKDWRVNPTAGKSAKRTEIWDDGKKIRISDEEIQKQ